MAKSLAEFDRPRHRLGGWDFVLYLLAAVGTAAFVLIFSPLIAWAAAPHYREERRTRRKLSREGRLIPWTAARERVLAGDGILVVELLPKGYGHTWWIDSARLAAHPDCPLPRFDAPRNRELYEGLFYQGPIVDWCEAHLPALLATASRVVFPSRAWLDDTLPPDRVRLAWHEYDHPPTKGPTPPTLQPMPPLRNDL